MQHPAWVTACAETFVPPDRLRLFVFGCLPQPAAVAPFVERRSFGRRLELLGPGEVHEPMDLIFQNETVLNELLRALLERRLPIVLRRVPADSETLPALRRAWRGGGLVVSRPARSYPFLELDSRWTGQDPPLGSSKRRSDLRRARRRAQEIGPIACEVTTPAPEDLPPLFDEMVRVEASGWKHAAGTSLAADRPRAAFFRRFAAAACRAGILRLCFLRIGGRPAAVQLAVELDRRFWLLKVGYDDRFQRCSPGSLLLAETVRHAAQRGLRSYEFLGVGEPWTEAWTDRVRPHVDIYAYPWSRRGGTALAADTLSSVRQKISRAAQGPA
ncbi:MAG: GNAT family N-acetyltransferase [Acidobacteria bacterium]|nr:GNAT family N-acetyltransferase [Acidobacteriota bacterium]